MTLTYNTTFGTPLGQTQERINATFEYDQDFTGDTYNDIKVTLELESADNSGTEDMIGIAFDINNDAVSNLAIQNIQRSTENGTLSTFPPISYITTNGVPSNGQNAIPGFLVDVPADGIKFDVGIQFSDGGSGEGIVQSASFILTKPGTSIGKSLIENTDWYIRLQSTDGGAGSAKMGGVIGEISDAKPKIEINKVTNGVDNLQVLAGSDVTWTYTVTNPGNVALSNVLLTDDKQGQITNLTDGDNGNQQLDPGETWVYTATGTALPGNYSNLGTVTGDYNGKTVDAKDPSNYFGADPKIEINKVTNGVDNLQVLAGSPVTWTYTVTNPGNVALSNVLLTDDKQGTITNLTDGDNGNQLLDPGETWVYTATGTALPGNYSNLGTVTGNYNGTPVTAKDPSNYFGANPLIKIDKVTTATTATGVQTGDNLQNVLLGSAVTWTYTVTNPGNVALSNVSLTDDKQGTIGNLISGSDANGNQQLDTNETWVYTATGTAFPGNYSNLGTVTGDYNGKTVDAKDPSGYSSQRGLGKTPGFWKQTQHFEYWPQPYKLYNTTADKDDDKFSTIFGVGTTDSGLFKYPSTSSGVKWFTDSLLGALSAEDLKGSTGSGAVKTYGNISALGRSATAALLNATSDELNNNVKGSNINYIIDPSLLLPEVVTFLGTKVDGIFDAVKNQMVGGDGIISSQEVLNAVKDVFTDGGIFKGPLSSDVNSLATAFDKMNNMAGG